MSEKPHKGRIKNWYFIQTHANTPPRIAGIFLDHPTLCGDDAETTSVLKFDAATGEIETRNTRYTLVSEGVPALNPRFPKKGDKMLFKGMNGYNGQLALAKKVFIVGHVYEVENCYVGAWDHSIAFVGIVGRFNGVMFEPSTQMDLPLPGAPDGTSDPEDEAGRAKD